MCSVDDIAVSGEMTVCKASAKLKLPWYSKTFFKVGRSAVTFNMDTFVSLVHAHTVSILRAEYCSSAFECMFVV